MIQRIQTLYLLLAGALAALLWYFDFRDIHTLATFLILPLLILLALVSLFLFKNRKIQFRFAVLGTLFSGVVIVLEYLTIQDLNQQHLVIANYHYFSPIIGLLMVLFFFLAARGIYKDNKLIKSQDRLR